MMEKVINFRDLGKIVTEDGRRIKEGLFFRSARLDEAGDDDIEFLKKLGLKVVFDYRENDEKESYVGDIYAAIGARHATHPVDLKNKKLLKLKSKPRLIKALQKVSIEDIKETYRNLPFDNNSYKQMVEALIAGEVPLLQHCSAGKDRAGLGSALLLAILGVGYDNILEDYMKSLPYKDIFQNKVLSYVPKPLRRLIRKRFEPLFIVDKVLLDTAFEEIIKKYGTLSAYFLAEYGLTAETIAYLKAQYTE